MAPGAERPFRLAALAVLGAGFGILLAMPALDGRYRGAIWPSMALMFLGLFRVPPRPRAPLAAADASRQDAV